MQTVYVLSAYSFFGGGGVNTVGQGDYGVKGLEPTPFTVTSFNVNDPL